MNATEEANESKSGENINATLKVKLAKKMNEVKIRMHEVKLKETRMQSERKMLVKQRKKIEVRRKKKDRID